MRKSNWGLFEDDFYFVVMPRTDIAPHGFPDKGATTAELAGADCPCKPVIVSGKDGQVFSKFVIVHNSFEDAKLVAESMEKLDK